MFDYLKGHFANITPTHIVVDCGGVGYHLHISLNTYEVLKGLKEGKVFVHLAISENNHTLYGFANEDERVLFRSLTSVSGVGPSTARMILSSQSTNEIINAIIQGNITLLKSIKGIGPKTAQRIVVELQDKLGKMNAMNLVSIQSSGYSPMSEEATMALEALGFNKQLAAKAVAKLLQSEPEMSIESLIKNALRIL